jgi:6-pyruvoyltetrahydropterin/6-carboxytetrahydropterin synthase
MNTTGHTTATECSNADTCKTNPIVKIQKSISFSSSHKLFLPHLSTLQNQTLFGKCCNLHGHNYLLKVTCKSTLQNGFVIDAKQLKSMMENVTQDFDHNNLNEILPLPTAENVVVLLWTRLRILLGDKLYQVDLHETDSISVSFNGEFA